MPPQTNELLLLECIDVARQLHVHSTINWSKFYRRWLWVHPDKDGDLGCYASQRTLAKLLEVLQRKAASLPD